MRRMKKKKQNPSFFKVLIYDFTSKLILPPTFSRTCGGILRVGSVKLRSRSGRTWKVKLEKAEEGHNKYHFTGGWSQFVEDALLQFGEFLVFNVVNEFMLDVDIYEATCSRREIPGDISSDDDSEDYKAPEAKKQIVPRYLKFRNVGGALTLHGKALESPNLTLCFKVVLKYYHRYRLNLPQSFYSAAGLMGKPDVLMTYLPTGLDYPVELRHRVSNRTLDLSEGWSDFRKANGMKLGRCYLFEFLPTKNVIQVRELKKKSQLTNQSFSYLHEQK